MKPADTTRPSAWTAYVLSGADRAERGRRLAEVPEGMRAAVRNMVAREFFIRKGETK
jgi:hypothetical protein